MFTSQRDIDMSSKPQITEDYLHKIDQNKVRPIDVKRDLIPLPWVIGIGLAIQNLMAPELFASMTYEARAVFYGIVILMIISHEINFQRQKNAAKKAVD